MKYKNLLHVELFSSYHRACSLHRDLVDKYNYLN